MLINYPDKTLKSDIFISETEINFETVAAKFGDGTTSLVDIPCPSLKKDMY